ncbi:MAG: prohibitin family protein [Bacteroidales bacterium]|nr:prohibitin family protein [Bacteroidales bacterium]
MTQQELNPKKFIPIAVLVVAVIILLISWNSITVTVDAGQGGVLFKRFGGGIDLENTYGEGFHFIAPWNKMYIYEVRQQEIGEDMNVLASNGLEIQVDVSTWYEPQFSKLGYLHAEIGTSYLQRIIIPSLRSAARSVVGRYTPEQIYSTKRDIIQDEIYEETKALLESKYVQVNQVLIRSIKLPATLKQAMRAN